MRTGATFAVRGSEIPASIQNADNLVCLTVVPKGTKAVQTWTGQGTASTQETDDDILVLRVLGTSDSRRRFQAKLGNARTALEAAVAKLAAAPTPAAQDNRDVRQRTVEQVSHKLAIRRDVRRRVEAFDRLATEEPTAERRRKRFSLQGKSLREIQALGAELRQQGITTMPAAQFHYMHSGEDVFAAHITPEEKVVVQHVVDRAGDAAAEPLNDLGATIATLIVSGHHAAITEVQLEPGKDAMEQLSRAFRGLALPSRMEGHERCAVVITEAPNYQPSRLYSDRDPLPTS